MKFIFIFILLGLTSCNKNLYQHYCRLYPGNYTYSLKLKPSKKEFSFHMIAGLGNDTLKGKYLINNKILQLIPDKGQVVKQSDRISTDIHLLFIDDMTKERAIFLNLDINQNKRMIVPENGEIIITTNDKSNTISVSNVFYEDFIFTIEGTGYWVVNLRPKVMVDSTMLKWRIKKDKIKTDGFIMNKCK